MTNPTLIYYSVLNFQPESLKLLNNHFKVISLDDPECDSSEILSAADIMLAPPGYFLGKEKIDQAPRLKIIGSSTTALPHIDVDYALKKGIQVVSLKAAEKDLEGITAAAESVWGLIIMLTHNFLPACKAAMGGKWHQTGFGGKTMLSRMSLGIIGLGRVGKKVASYGLCFGMQIFYFDPGVATGYPGIVKVDSLAELVDGSDIISVHVPVTSETNGMIDRGIFDLIKKGSFFVNTAGEELIDQSALLEKLQDDTLAAAAINLFAGQTPAEFEKRPDIHPLCKYAVDNDNLIIVSNTGDSTDDALRLKEEFAIKSILAALDNSKNRDTDANFEDKIKRGEVWGLIPARGGSKSIPLKNMIDLDGRPLIDYVIRAGQASESISRIFSSTDNQTIRDYCQNAGIEVQERPAELARDNVSTLDVVTYFLKQVLKETNSLPEYLVLLEPTSPFVLSSQINECVELLKSDPQADSAQTVTPVSPNSHSYNQRYHDENGSHFIFQREREIYFNKQLKPQFYIHGNVRVMRVESLLKKNDLFGDRSLPVVIPRIYSMDVDGPYELELARCILKNGSIIISE